MQTMMTTSQKMNFLNELREDLKRDQEIEELFNDPVLDPEEGVSDRDPYDPVSRPSHYVKNGLESIDVIEAFVPDPYSFYMGNVLKYVQRHLDKNKVQDLNKARWYLDKMIEDWND